ncbi:MAG: glycosyltransferase [Candidatus Aenigmarchaeota archaeon]|nr:glycosyltransferase [Candidatus Aenigmarchaeota archaeon]
MRIVHVTKYFSGNGGIESYTRSISKAALAAGHDVHVICAAKIKKYSEHVENGVKVVRLPKISTIMNAPLTRPVGPVLERLRPDVIHLHMPNPWAEVNVFLYKLSHPKTRLIATYHSDVIAYNPLMRFLSTLRLAYLVPSMGIFCDKIISTSGNYVSGSAALRMLRKKTVIIPLGVDVKTFSPAKTKNKNFTFLFVGRLIPYKGLENLIKACGIVKGSGKKFILNIVGDGKLYQSLRKSASDRGVKDRVKFLRSVSDSRLPSIYRKCDVFILPSVYKSEAFGLAQLEAMSSGKPVISTNIKGSGVPFVNKNGYTGIVVKPRDEISLANAMMLLMDDKKLRLTMGLNARKRAVNFFNEKMISRKVLETYIR